MTPASQMGWQVKSHSEWGQGLGSEPRCLTPNPGLLLDAPGNQPEPEGHVDVIN